MIIGAKSRKKNGRQCSMPIARAGGDMWTFDLLARLRAFAMREAG
ncbi:hypothetical protein [Azovibrio restrictus]|nr:hypothetical protein [Azovibrio restrictus]